MSLNLIEELHTRAAKWRMSLNDDAARLRYYQRNLLAMRRHSPRPHNSVRLTLRQCAAARKMTVHASRVLTACRREINRLSGARSV